MKTKTLLGSTGRLGLLALASFASPAALAGDSGWYLGGNAGLAQASIDDQGITAGLLGNGFTTTGIRDDESDLGFKLFGGYQLNRHFALEAGYFNLGEFDFTATTVPAGTLAGRIKLSGLNLDAVGRLPFTERFSAFGRAGVNYAEAKDRFTGTGAVNVVQPKRDKRDANYKFGLGLQYELTERLGLRAEAERYRIDDAVGSKGDVDLLSLGLVYRFFGASPATAVAVAPPAPLVRPPPPAPAPAAPVVASAPPLMAVRFSANSLFDFDQSSLRPEGRPALDQFAAQLRGVQYERITVTGHSDRIGTEAYNLRLSSERAQAVKDYLVQSAGIAADSVSVRGVDGAQPLTKAGDCSDEQPRAERIACLQPDRRVEVEVSGTRSSP
ncbi:MAG: outer membrane beta-barrel protein [Stagnimonas sp.]|nr:outer membrane beta-barrel protein [Stagnimonas sp.]